MTEPRQVGGGGVVIASDVVEEVEEYDEVDVVEVEEVVDMEEVEEEEVIMDDVETDVSLSPASLIS